MGFDDQIKERISKTSSYLEPVLIDSGSADLKSFSVPRTSSVAQVLKEIQNSVLIEGHTNIPIRRGEYNSNWEFSSARAQSVLKFLIEKENLPPERFSALGYGEYKPAVSNDTPEGRAVNRRIEINVMRLE